MNSILISEILFVIFVMVDDWYPEYTKAKRENKPGQKPESSDSDVMTTMLAMEFIPFPSERQFVAYLRANHLELFPKLLDQSQFNRRARAVAPLLEEFRQHWLVRLGLNLVSEGLLETKPVRVVGIDPLQEWI